MYDKDFLYDYLIYKYKNIQDSME